MGKKDKKYKSMKVIFTGTTGMVGEGVLYECLQHTQIEAVLVVNRKRCGVWHPKLKEILHADFFDLSPIEPQLAGYDACFFCLGVSSVGMKEPDCTRMTCDLTLHFAEMVSRLNPDMTFGYISGASTDSTEYEKQVLEVPDIVALAKHVTCAPVVPSGEMCTGRDDRGTGRPKILSAKFPPYATFVA